MKVQSYLFPTLLLALFPSIVSAGMWIPFFELVGCLIEMCGPMMAWSAAGSGTVAAGVVAGTAGDTAVRDKKLKASQKSVKSAASVASVSSASVASRSSVISASKESVSKAWTSNEAKARAGLASLTSAQAAALSSLDPALNVFTFHNSATKSKRSIQAEETSSSSTYLSRLMQKRMDLTKRTIATNATGWPIAPPGVPQFNYDDCVVDVKAQIADGGNITMYQPEGVPNAIQVDHVPPRCMVLASVILSSSADKGGHPIAFGSASLRWLGVTDEQINDLKTFFKSGGKANESA